MNNIPFTKKLCGIFELFRVRFPLKFKKYANMTQNLLKKLCFQCEYIKNAEFDDESESVE